MLAKVVSSPGGWEDLGAVLEVEVVDVLGGKERTALLVWRREHGGDQPAGARPGDHVEVVCDPRVRPVQLLQTREWYPMVRGSNLEREPAVVRISDRHYTTRACTHMHAFHTQHICILVKMHVRHARVYKNICYETKILWPRSAC